MYRLKEEIELQVENHKKLAEEIGLSPETFSRIIRRKQACSKIAAYSITKHLFKDLEILDLFERI